MHLISHTCNYKLFYKKFREISFISIEKDEFLIEQAKTRFAAPDLAQIGSLPLFYMLFPSFYYSTFNIKS